MKILLHTCCAPCLTYPLSFFKEKKIAYTVYFFNPNIHPFKEFKKRKDCLASFVKKNQIPSVFVDNYGLLDFTRRIAFKEEKRCSICYDLRLEQTVLFAKENGFTSFSSTLLYSRYQKHSLILKKCLSLSERFNIDFFYHDFREGWQSGIDISLSEQLYRQPYCGCIYSEQERYDNKLKKALNKKKKREFIT